MERIRNLAELKEACEKHAGCGMLRIGTTRFMHYYKPMSKNLPPLVFETPPREEYELDSKITLRDIVLECARWGIFFNSPQNEEKIEEWLKAVNLSPFPGTEKPEEKISVPSPEPEDISEPESEKDQEEEINFEGKNFSSPEEYIRALEENFPAPEALDDFLEGAGASSVSEVVRSLINGVTSGKVDELSTGELTCLLLPGFPIEDTLKILFGLVLKKDDLDIDGLQLYESPTGEKWQLHATCSTVSIYKLSA